MTTLYEYNDLTKSPAIGYIREEIAKSAMADKAIADIQARLKSQWNSGDCWLKIWFESELSTDDKAILDSTVAASIGKVITKNTRTKIMGDIYDQAEPETQLPRLMAALNTAPVFIVALDNYNFDLARLILGQLLTGGAITQEDFDLINSIIPASKWVAGVV